MIQEFLQVVLMWYLSYSSSNDTHGKYPWNSIGVLAAVCQIINRMHSRNAGLNLNFDNVCYSNMNIESIRTLTYRVHYCGC